MADDKTKSRSLRKTETVREKAARASSDKSHNRRLRKTASSVKKPVNKLRAIGKKELYLPMPNNRVGRFLNKRRSLVPSFFKAAWREFRMVQWPTKRQTASLTFAVFIFAIIFGLMVAIVDFGLDKVFRKVFVE